MKTLVQYLIKFSDNEPFSEKFIYFNDDIAFTKPICLKDFWNAEKGFQVFLQGSRGPARNFICPGTWFTLAY